MYDKVRRFLSYSQKTHGGCSNTPSPPAGRGLMTPGDLTFDLTKTVAKVISSLFLTLFRTPLSPYRYVAQEPSWKGVFNPPPHTHTPAGRVIPGPQAGRGLKGEIE